MSKLLTNILNDLPGQNKNKTDNLKPVKVDTHKNKNGHPQNRNVGVNIKKVDTHKMQENQNVDVNESTFLKSGHPQNAKIENTKKDRHRADLKRINFRLTPELHQLFQEFRVKHKLEIQEFFTLAALRFIEQSGHPQNQNVDSFASQDDRRKMILFSTKPSIINIYTKYHPYNKWKPTDDAIASRFNDVDEKIIELAILQTQGNAGYKKIYSFKYYVTEIEYLQEMALQEKTINTMLERRKQQWKEFSIENLKK
jgi:hypothetical protein